MAEAGQSELYEAFGRRGVTVDTVERLMAWPAEKLFQLCVMAQNAVREPPQSREGPFNFVANDSLSGAAVPFATPESRREKVTQLARFAALYADMLLVRNPFDHYPLLPSVLKNQQGLLSEFERGMEPHDFDDPKLRRHFVDDVRLILFLRPLFDADLVGFAKSSQHWCPSCIRALQDRGDLHKVLETPAEVAWQRRIAKVVKHIEQAFLKKGRTLVHQHGDHAHATIFLPSGVLEYEQAQVSVKLPKRLAHKASEPINLSLREAREIHIFASEINRIVDDISAQNAAANRFNCQYITDRAIDLELMNLVSDKAARNFNSAAADALSHPLAFVGNVPLERILKIRKQEGEAFFVYRDAMRKLLSTARGKTSKELREAFDDEIRPELNRIDLTLKNARKIVSVSALTDAVLLFASVSIAAFSGLLPQSLGIPAELLNVGAALGGWKGVTGLASKVSALRSTPKEVSENKYAFLWRIRDERSRRRRKDRTAAGLD